MARENLWLVKCMDRDGDDVNDLREEHMPGHLAHIEAIVDHIAMAGPLKDPSGERIVGSMLAYRTDDLEQAKAWLEGDPYARCGIWGSIEWSRLVLAAGTLAGGVTWYAASHSLLRLRAQPSGKPLSRPRRHTLSLTF